ncbi:hypothetical protein OEZ85_009372 [Tetradesmus obliquus]|uniref:Uncharacterized protein n=1 Tax=Tetradesmus obliquus TaxID=3088 RepID=A0ABY8U8S5_TETOB|nr:hypothetical protein OEZ85_009372 [Tetradesmus obliquus]
MEQLQLADDAAASASAQHAAFIYVRGAEALCVIQAATWLSLMQQQDACDPLAGALVGLQQQATGQVELLLVRSCRPAVDGKGCVLLDSTRLSCSGVRGDSTQRLADACDLQVPKGSADCICLSSWQAAAQQLQQQVPRLLGTKQQVGGNRQERAVPAAC